MKNNKNIIRENNINTLKNFMFKNETALKSEISKETGISVVTTNSLVKELVEENTLIEGKLIHQPLGRPAFTYHFNYDKSLFLLLSVQENQINNIRKLKIISKVVNLKGNTKYIESADFFPVTIDFLINSIYSNINKDFDISKIALSIPGKIFDNVILSSLDGLFNNWNISKELCKLTSIPISIQNDAHLLTVGYTLLHEMNTSDTIVGIFYPENSMPGITIFNHGSILEGGHNLAGEAKFLPHLIDKNPPTTEFELVKNLTQILEIYNSVISPDSFIISVESGTIKDAIKQFNNSLIISNHVNKPDLFFIENFETALDKGLLWLLNNNSPYI